MPLWTLENPPKFMEKTSKEGVATARGWENAKSKQKELIVAIPSLAVKAGEANVLAGSFGQLSYVQGAPLSVAIRYNERVNVTAGAAIVVSWSGLSGNITLYAAAQLGVNDVVFDLDAMAVPAVVPAEAGVLSLAAQSIVGVIVDANDNVTPSDLAISAAAAAAAGTRTVA